MRAFRPSRFAPVEEFEEDHQRDKEANVEQYAKLVEAGMPLFDGPLVLGEPRPHSSNALSGK